MTKKQIIGNINAVFEDLATTHLKWTIADIFVQDNSLKETK